jgi:sorting nexin-9/18/33
VQLATHEALKDVAHPSVLYAVGTLQWDLNVTVTIWQPVVDTHKSTLSRYKTALKGKGNTEEITGRCETVLNTTMSEFSTYHSQKQEDFERITLEHLNGEIELHTSILERLKAAKAAFYTPEWEGLSAIRSGPRQASRYERDLPRVDPRTGVLDMGKAAGSDSGPQGLGRNALVEPAPHVWDSAPMRPVSAAIQEGVGMLFGSPSVPSLYGRGSVFGKLW